MENIDSKHLDDEINLKEIFLEIFKNKNFIILVTFTFSLIGVVYSLLQPNIYTSNAVLMASGQNSSSQSSSLSSIASSAGIKIGSSGGVDNNQLVVQMVKSREFFQHLSTFEGILPSIYASKSFDKKTQSLTFDASIYDSSKNIWISEKPNILEAYELYDQSVFITHSINTGMIYLRVVHKSPIFAQSLCKLIISELNALSKNRAALEASSSLDYLYAELSKTPQQEIKQSISALIEGQLRTKMLANVRNDYLVRTLDSPQLPYKKSAPWRTLICLIFMFSGFLTSLSYVLIRFYGFRT
tara:strand:- start:600 stop:1496 length:897 start_codon:yes stop_codon:yes gene_type:complete